MSYNYAIHGYRSARTWGDQGVAGSRAERVSRPRGSALALPEASRGRPEEPKPIHVYKMHTNGFRHKKSMDHIVLIGGLGVNESAHITCGANFHAGELQ